MHHQPITSFWKTSHLAYYDREKALDKTRGVSLLCIKITVFNLTSPFRTRCDPRAGRDWTIPYKSAPFTMQVEFVWRLQERAKWQEIRSVEYINPYRTNVENRVSS